MAEEKPKSKKKKTIIMMTGGFLLSFLVTNIAMYFLLKMTQPTPAPQMTQQAQSPDSSVVASVLTDTAGVALEVTKNNASADSTKSELNLAANGLSQDSLIPAGKVKEMMAHLLKEQDTSLVPPSEMAEPLSTEGASDSNQAELKVLMSKGGNFDMNRIARLAKIFEAMKPKQAAPVLSQLDNDVIVMILLKMKERPAAKILGEMSVERAASISRQISQKVLES
jgi:flagellar motility protein MotE (MotC chaperone)